MSDKEMTPATPESLRREAAQSKARVRKRLEAMLETQLHDAAATELLADMPWQDPSRSGEFEAVLT
ncbi:MAG: hypothetical protein MK074_09085 [Phycisphaerales bacterium]|nr:hypothetical protein [Phycisphaerales bacterium]